ncbi:hypothetical protein Tco_0087328 [Tanacetum coccineum]
MSHDVRGTVGQVYCLSEESWSGLLSRARGTLIVIRSRFLMILGWSTTGLGTMRNLESDCQLATLPGTKITLVHTSSELAVRRPGKAPERVVRSLSPSLGTMRNLGWSKTGLGMMRNLESDSQLSTLSSTKVLSRARKLGQVATTWRGTVGAGLPSCEVQLRAKKFIKWLRRARNVGSGLRRDEETWSSRYTGEELSGHVNLERGVNLVKSLRRAKNRQGRSMSCENFGQVATHVRGTVGAAPGKPTNLDEFNRFPNAGRARHNRTVSWCDQPALMSPNPIAELPQLSVAWARVVTGLGDPLSTKVKLNMGLLSPPRPLDSVSQDPFPMAGLSLDSRQG